MSESPTKQGPPLRELDEIESRASNERDGMSISEADMAWDICSSDSLAEAQWSAMKAALIGLLPAVLFVVAIVVKSEADRSFVSEHMIPLIIGGFGLMICLSGCYVLVVGMAGGWLAHRFAFETTVPVSRLAIAIAWAANLSLWAWAVVVVMRSS